LRALHKNPLFSYQQYSKLIYLRKHHFNTMGMLFRPIDNALFILLLPLVQHVVTAGRAWLAGGEIIDNRLNPNYLAIATTGYRIQSSLHIPNRIGFFSPGPPRLQVHQATSFIYMVIVTCVIGSLDGLTVLWMTLRPLPDTDLPKTCVIFVSVLVGLVVFFWVLECCNGRRAPGYEWAGWKERRDSTHSECDGRKEEMIA
jgi:hypothetical protein